MPKDLNRPLSVALVIIILSTRFLPHPPNFTAVGATALFSGAKLSRPFNYLTSISAMFLSDLVFGFHRTMLFVYPSFLFYSWLGERYLKSDNRIIKAGFLSLIGSAVFFIVTNFGVWLTGSLYPKTVEGLILCYINGLPFARNMVVGDIFYTVVIFSAFALMSEQTALRKVENKLLSLIETSK